VKHKHWLRKIGIMGVLGVLVLSSNPVWSAKMQSVASLTEQEKTDLVHMREEEKLARDVYQKLLDRWKLKIFVNIRESEQLHMDQIKVLLDRYGVDDPVSPDEGGVFTDSELQSLYTELVQKGEVSIGDALEVGIAIEELDIKDLDTAIKNTTRRDIRNVYSSLQEASGNHLDAFTNALDLIETWP
jgi:hypothetical protein